MGKSSGAVRNAKKPTSGGGASSNTDTKNRNTPSGGGGGGSSDNATSAKSEPTKQPSSKSKYGLQPNGTFKASNYKQFGQQLEKMEGKKTANAVILMDRAGSRGTRVEKTATTYVITSIRDGKPSRVEHIPVNRFEQNWRHHV